MQVSSLRPSACVYPSGEYLRDDEYVDVELWIEISNTPDGVEAITFDLIGNAAQPTTKAVALFCFRVVEPTETHL